MARISSNVGLISGLQTADIINQLISIEQEPVKLLQTRVDNRNQQKLAFTDLATRLTTLRISGQKLAKPSTFQNANAVSSDEGVLTATAAPGAATGSYQFQVARLVTTQQSISGGFSDPDASKLGAGTITIEQGGGELSTESPLSQLNGGAGVRRGSFRITDKSGHTAVIDASSAVTLQDVAKKINSSLDIAVRASVSKDGLSLTDLTGASVSNFIVQDIGSGQTAADLGIVANTATAGVDGADINYIGRSTLLSQLNDGRGISLADAGADFTVTDAAGGAHDVSLAGLTSVGQVLDAINTATGGSVTAQVVAGANGIQLVDHSGGGGGLSIAAKNGSAAAADLGIATSGAGATFNGKAVLSDLGTVLIGSLTGGHGLSLGSINITDASGASDTVDLSGANTIQDILNKITSDTHIHVTATLNDSANGIKLTDASGGGGSISASEGSGTTAADLGLIGSSAAGVLSGKNLQRQWVSQNTLLADYNGGKGVNLGSFRITASDGKSATISLSSGSVTSIGDLIKTINARGIGVTASINANGDGVALTDTAGGALKLSVADISGTAAADLNLAGSATGTVLDGSLEKTIAVDANDTLATVQKKINDLNFGVTASIINDGSGLAPFRLSLTAKNSGTKGRVVIDGGATALGVRNLVSAQDAAVFYGGAGDAQPLLITASSNQLTGVIKGVTIDLNGVSTSPVTLNITRTADNVDTELAGFTDTFNQLVDKVSDLTKYDTDTNTAGLLLGDSTVQETQSDLYEVFNAVVQTGGRFKTLADIGLSLGDDAKLVYDPDKFKAAYADDPDAVQKLFTDTTVGVGKLIQDKINKLIDPVSGVITLENKNLDSQVQQFNDRITQLNALIDQKRTRLETQFANLESVLANLQSQQQALSSFTGITPVKSSSSSK